jgi:hypothetical protein
MFRNLFTKKKPDREAAAWDQFRRTVRRMQMNQFKQDFPDMYDDCKHDYRPGIALNPMGGTVEFMECIRCLDYYQI